MAKADLKRRAWGFVVYPEHLEPAEITKRIEETHQQCILSPLHDRDTWTAADEEKNSDHKAGETKKPHFHGMWIFNGGVRKAQALELCEIFGDSCPPHVEPISSMYGYTRYLCHLDNPEKFQYCVDDITAFNGAKIKLESPRAQDPIVVLRAALNWLNETGCVEYGQLVQHCMECEPDWLPIVSRKAVFFGHYLASVRSCDSARKVVRRV